MSVSDMFLQMVCIACGCAANNLTVMNISTGALDASSSSVPSVPCSGSMASGACGCRGNTAVPGSKPTVILSVCAMPCCLTSTPIRGLPTRPGCRWCGGCISRSRPGYRTPKARLASKRFSLCIAGAGSARLGGAAGFADHECGFEHDAPASCVGAGLA